MTLRLGVVGCGAIAEEMHVPAAVGMPGVSLVALVDVDLRRAEDLASRFGVERVSTRLEDVSTDLDAIVIATPPDVRSELCATAFGLGLNVLAEKPLANTKAECDAIVGAARRAGCVLAVGHMFRFYPVRRELVNLVEQHGLGAIREIVAAEGQPYNWHTRTGYTVRRELVSGGVVINAGVHTLDTIISVLGDPVGFDYEDDALGGLESNARIVMTFCDGVVSRYRLSRTCRLPFRLKVICERGALEFSLRAVGDYRVTKDGRVSEYSCGDPSLTPMDCWKSQLDDFVQSIRDGREPLVNGEEGARVVTLIEKMYESKRARSLPAVAPSPGVTW